ncbi:hypothetical protein CFN79_09390 [Chromobacterium vaccinii]|nr:hypothetical protein CFN79_09390 [Chromobacterium vaccinii]
MRNMEIIFLNEWPLTQNAQRLLYHHWIFPHQKFLQQKLMAYVQAFQRCFHYQKARKKRSPH